MLWSGALWFAAILLFGQTTYARGGHPLLFAAGFVQSFCLTPLAAVMLRSSDDSMRGRVMGVRMLAIWGLPLGLLAAGRSMIATLGYPPTTVLYASACGHARHRLPLASRAVDTLGGGERRVDPYSGSAPTPSPC